MADKIREAVVVRIASYQRMMGDLYNKHIKPCAFQAEDVVLRRVFENTDEPVIEKF